jgi:hypothetical protein
MQGVVATGAKWLRAVGAEGRWSLQRKTHETREGPQDDYCVAKGGGKGGVGGKAARVWGAATTMACNGGHANLNGGQHSTPLT